MTDSIPILDDDAVAEIEAQNRIFMNPNIDALCNTVRALREMVYVPKILPDDEDVTYQQEGARLLRAKLALQSQLEQVTKERNQLLEAMNDRRLAINGATQNDTRTETTN